MLSEGEQTCLCGRSFAQQSALSNHKRSCSKSKKRFSATLDMAKQAWTNRKRRRVDSEDVQPQPGLTLAGPFSQPSAPNVETIRLQMSINEPEHIVDDSHIPMLERRPWNLRRNRQLPLRFRDELPQPPSPALPVSRASSVPSTAAEQPPADQSCHPSPAAGVGSRLRRIFTTPHNVFGLFRRYNTADLPSYNPEEHITLQELSNVPPDNVASDYGGFYPFPNCSAFNLGEWLEDFRELTDILGDPDFRLEDIRDVNWDRINKELGTDDGDGEWLDEDAGWERTPVTISVPYQSHRGIQSKPDAGPRNYVVEDFYHRSLVSVIREKILGLGDAHQFHFEPYELLWQMKNSRGPIRIQGELYTSPAFMDAHQELQGSPGKPGCDLPQVIVALMFWSDATQLTAFGNAKLWPLYMFFGNESKYQRCKPSCHLCEHVAYFQTLPDSFKDFASTQTAGGKAPSSPFMTHCHREFFHEQWKVLLDDAFIEAWKHSMVILCCDGIHRRFYPRIFTYSADYPEKNTSQRVTMARVDNHQHHHNILSARRFIYDLHYSVNSAAVEALLHQESWVPTLNAFSERLAPMGFNQFKMLLPDLMHEFELGVWRAVFIHLLRILQSVDDDLILKLDRRYQEIPSFGRDTIQRFASNCSELKKMAAHDFENLLQCAIPAFDGLLPEPHNRAVTELLFVMAHWHAMAKLRMHNDITLDIMQAATVALGKRLRLLHRKFSQTTCSAFATKELHREYNARLRREVKQSAKKVRGKAAGSRGIEASAQAPASKRRYKTLNLNTFKAHYLGYYAEIIHHYGTSDSYSSEPGELEHRSPKARYSCTSHKGFVKQMTQIERRQARIRRIRKRLHKAGNILTEDIGRTTEVHHNIGKSQNFPENIFSFVRNNNDDPAVKDFIPHLKSHILPRIHDMLRQEAIQNTSSNIPGSSTMQDISNHNSIFFKSDCMYRHQLGRFNYTTYNVRRSQDVINPGTTHRDIMLLANDCDVENGDRAAKHPFLYARVLGIYHVNVIYTGEGQLDYTPRRVEFLWVQWFEYDGRSVGWPDTRLDSLRFPPMATDGTFGFVDPKNVLRGCHIIPSFASGKAQLDGVGLSRLAQDAQDWSRYRVNRFVDCDMVMRYYWGLAAGHIYTHSCDLYSSNGRSTPPVPDGTEPLEPEMSIPAVDANIQEDEDDAEFGFENRQDDILEEDLVFDEEQGLEDDDEFLAMYDMYGPAFD
ncbi:hypothetical protein PILCRDRAFT_98847 [Piloderma croceum F 1598]|uniref:Uncharacterized protein n=1 Tax=Piloderma croceum (strain F 1598) TaxID=765440 RepID=A0A0C3BET3_PILCF|nr:hypothetical protein PILCRDRAFT_98847 [Piloderma croceum F 1598]